VCAQLPRQPLPHPGHHLSLVQEQLLNLHFGHSSAHTVQHCKQEERGKCRMQAGCGSCASRFSNL
jgi:hypothetical protein